MKNEKEELLHRREFFKKAAKGTLPIIAAIVAPPLLVGCDKNEDFTGCADCSGTCASDCSSSCIGQSSSSTCSNCANNCMGGCDTTCSNTCKNNSTNSSDSDEISKATGALNGYEYVDLGLSVKWARYNIGTSEPQKYGSYMEFTEGATGNKYIDVRLALLSAGLEKGDSISATSFDSATKRWGNYWRLPTKKEFEELIENCTYKVTTYKNINGAIFKSKKNGKSIFLPFYGRIDFEKKEYVGICCYYWTGTIQYLKGNGAYAYFFSSMPKGISYDNIANQKYSIRPVTEGKLGPNTCGGGCSSNCASNSTSSSCSSCSSTCSNSCKTRCDYNCAATCDNHCYGSCNDSCGGSCKYLNSGSNCSGCAQTCYNRCYHDCSYACSTNCQSSCVNGSK